MMPAPMMTAILPDAPAPPFAIDGSSPVVHRGATIATRRNACNRPAASSPISLPVMPAANSTAIPAVTRRPVGSMVAATATNG